MVYRKMIYFHRMTGRVYQAMYMMGDVDKYHMIKWLKMSFARHF